MHVTVWDCTFSFDEQFDGLAGNLELAVDQLFITSMLVALLEFKMQRDFLELLSCCEL